MRAGFEQQLDAPADLGITSAHVVEVRRPRLGRVPLEHGEVDLIE
jgi:hypothetical protein